MDRQRSEPTPIAEPLQQMSKQQLLINDDKGAKATYDNITDSESWQESIRLSDGGITPGATRVLH